MGIRPSSTELSFVSEEEEEYCFVFAYVLVFAYYLCTARLICIARLARLREAAKGQELLASPVSHRSSRIIRLLLYLFCHVYLFCSVLPTVLRLSGYFSCVSTCLSLSKLPRAFPLLQYIWARQVVWWMQSLYRKHLGILFDRIHMYEGKLTVENVFRTGKAPP